VLIDLSILHCADLMCDNTNAIDTISRKKCTYTNLIDNYKGEKILFRRKGNYQVLLEIFQNSLAGPPYRRSKWMETLEWWKLVA
jgi:hypothetical protein